MEETAYIISMAAGAFYLIVACRLLQLSRKTGEHPELLLGIYFATTGQWYLFYNAPYFFGLEGLPRLFEQGVEWVYAVGVIPYLLFIRSAFRPGSTWATALVTLATLCLLAGAFISSIWGEFSNSIDDPGYMIEWIGYTIPCFWMCCEGFASHAAARKRVRMGLCDTIVANRYLLFGWFGVCQTAACAADLLWAHGNSTGAASTALANGLLSGTEIASVAVLWLAFFPPSFYANWIARRAQTHPTPAET
ncbi:MAG: hypothetical protein JRE38_07210 [Deltaproteobacteria bacterium]|nr:hypothetical protein [Deltaproteobacteria bacterium]MBW2577841.1 hypothetical protein [Deltaproteobacteria bacterium]MBW2693066.1 hypothetical protein [Deltaproteobacteria bacterium]